MVGLTSNKPDPANTAMERWLATEGQWRWLVELSMGHTMLLLMVLLTALFVGCTHAQRVQVNAASIPFTQQLRMHKGDAYEFQLSGGKTVAVWCEQPQFGMMLGEQTTKSGLKTAWGERPFKRPESLMRQIGPNTYESAGWKSYIVQGAVMTSGDRTSEYELFVGDLRFAIIEDLRATDALPVTIKITPK